MLNFNVMIDSLPQMMIGAGMTIVVSGSAIALGIIGGFLLCFMSISANATIRLLARIYISAFRGTPILVQLIIAYYLLPVIGLSVPPIVAAVAALAMNTSAFQAEIYRGGFQSLPPGQMEAARSLGISRWQARLRIQIPQVMRLVIPSLVNETISILKNSALVSVIAVVDLMRVSQTLVASTFYAAEIYIAAAVMYLIMNLTLATIGRYYERRLSRYV